MARSKKRRVAISGLVLFLLALVYFGLGYPMAFRAGNWRTFLGAGPAGTPRYRAMKLIEQTPVVLNIPREKEAVDAFTADNCLSQNSPYPRSMTLGENRYRLMNRAALIAPAPAAIAYRFKVPAKAHLEFGYSVRKFLDNKLQSGARFIVEWQGPAGTTRLFTAEVVNTPRGFWEKSKKREQIYHRYLFPRFGRWGDAFRDATVDLAPYAGQEGELRFITEPLDPAAKRLAPAVWSSPEVWAERPAGEPVPLNVVMFVIEATPVSEVQPYTTRPAVTPNLAAFAAQSAVFDKYFTVGDSTQLSTFCIFTGRHYRAMGLPNEMYFLAPMVKARFYQSHYATLAEAFSREGYKTAQIGSNLFFLPTRQIGLDLGFDDIDALNRRYYTSADTMLAAMGWLRRNGNKPFLLYVHYDAPHDEEKPCLEDLLRTLTVRLPDSRWTYRKSIAQIISADRALAELLEALQILGLRERTLVIVTADHGNCVDPAHNFAVLKPGRDPWWTPFQHGRSMRAEDIHVPLIVNWPIGPGGGRRIEAPVASVDLFPTLVDLVLPTPAPDFRARMAGLDGRSLAGLLEPARVPAAEKFSGHPVIYSVSAGGESLIVDGRWHYFRRAPGFDKLLFPGEDRLKVAREGVYDLTADPRELSDLSADQPELLKRMKKTLVQARPAETMLRFIYFNYPTGKVRGVMGLGGTTPPSLTMTYAEGQPPLSVRDLTTSEGPGERVAEFEFDLKGPAGLLLDRPVRWLDLSLDQETVFAPEFRLGPYGLNLLGATGCFGPAEWDPQANVLRERVQLEDCPALPASLLQTSHHPARYMNLPGVYFYEMKFTDFVEETFSDDRLSPAVRSVLQQWGYIE